MGNKIEVHWISVKIHVALLMGNRIEVHWLSVKIHVALVKLYDYKKVLFQLWG